MSNINPLGQFVEQKNGTVYYREGLLEDAPEFGPGIYQSWRYNFDAGRQVFKAQANGKIYEKRLIKDQYGTPKWTGWLEIPDAESRGVNAIAINDKPLQLPNSDGAIKLAITPESINAYTREETYDLIEAKINEREYEGFFVYIPWNHDHVPITPQVPDYFPQNAPQTVKDALIQLLMSPKVPNGMGKSNVYYIVEPSDYHDEENYFIWDVVDPATNRYGWIQSTPVSGFITYSVFNEHRNNYETHLSPDDRENIDYLFDTGIPNITNSLSNHFINYRHGAYSGIWGGSRVYRIYDIVLYKGDLWQSLSNNNLANEPNDTSSVWKIHSDVIVPNNLSAMPWSNSTVYNRSDLVKLTLDNGAEAEFLSIIDNNINNDPKDNSIAWLEYIPNSTPASPNYSSAIAWNVSTVYQKYDVVLGSPLNYYLSLSNSNMGNAISNPMFWLGFNINNTGLSFNVTSLYLKNELVEFQNQSWIAVMDVPPGNQPNTGSPFWALVMTAQTQNNVRYLHISEVERKKIEDSATELDLFLHKNDQIGHVTQGDRDRWDNAAIDAAPPKEYTLYNGSNQKGTFAWEEAYTQVEYGTEAEQYIVGTELQGLTFIATIPVDVIGNFQNKFDEMSPMDYKYKTTTISVGPCQIPQDGSIQFEAYDASNNLVASSPVWNVVDMTTVQKATFGNSDWSVLKVITSGTPLASGNYAEIENLKIWATYTVIEEKVVIGPSMNQGIRIESNASTYVIGDYSGFFKAHEDWDLSQLKITMLQSNTHGNDIQFIFYKPGSTVLVQSYSPVWTAAEAANPSMTAVITPQPFGRVEIKVMNTPPLHPGGRYADISSFKVTATMRKKVKLTVGDRDQQMPLDLVGPGGILPTYNGVPLRSLIENNYHTNEWGYINGNINNQHDLVEMIQTTSGNNVAASPDDLERYDVFYKGTIKSLVQNEGVPPITKKTVKGPTTWIKLHSRELFTNINAEVQAVLNSGSAIQRIDFVSDNVQCNVTGAYLYTDNQMMPISKLFEDQEDTPFTMTYTIYDSFSNFDTIYIAVPDKTVTMPNECGSWQGGKLYQRNDSVIIDATGQRYICLVNDTINRQPDKAGNEQFWKPYRHRGIWSTALTYNQNDLVGYVKTDPSTGAVLWANTFISLKNSNNAEPTENGDVNWELFEVGLDPTVSIHDGKLVIWVLTFGDIKAGQDSQWIYDRNIHDYTPYVNYRTVGLTIQEDSRDVGIGLEGISRFNVYEPGTGTVPFTGYPKGTILKWNFDPLKRQAHEWDIFYAIDDVPASPNPVQMDPNKWVKINGAGQTENEAYTQIRIARNPKFYSTNADLATGKNQSGLKAYDASGNLVGNDVVKVYEQEIDSRFASRNRFQNLGTNGGSYTDTWGNTVTLTDDKAVVNADIIRSETDLTKTSTQPDTEIVTNTERIPGNKIEHKGQLIFESHAVKGLDTDPTKGLIDPETNTARKYTTDDHITKVKTGNGLEIVHVDQDNTGTYNGTPVDVTDADGQVIGTMVTDKYEIRMNGVYDGDFNLLGDVQIGTLTTASQGDLDTQLVIYSDTHIGTPADQNKVNIYGDTTITANNQVEEGEDHTGSLKINLTSPDATGGLMSISATNNIHQDSDTWDVTATTSAELTTTALTVTASATADLETDALTVVAHNTTDLTTDVLTLEATTSSDITSNTITVHGVDMTINESNSLTENVGDAININSGNTMTTVVTNTMTTSTDHYNLIATTDIGMETDALLVKANNTAELNTDALTVVATNTTDLTSETIHVVNVDAVLDGTTLTINESDKVEIDIGDKLAITVGNETVIESANTIDVTTTDLTVGTTNTTISDTNLVVNSTNTNLNGENLTVDESTKIDIITPAFTLVDKISNPEFTVKAYTAANGKTIEAQTDHVIINTDNTIYQETVDIVTKAEKHEIIGKDNHTGIKITQDSDILIPNHDSKIEIDADDLTMTGNMALSGTDLVINYTNKVDITGGNDIALTTTHLNIDSSATVDLDTTNLTITATDTTDITTKDATLTGETLVITESNTIDVTGTNNINVDTMALDIEATDTAHLLTNALSIEAVNTTDLVTAAMTVTGTSLDINESDKMEVSTGDAFTLNSANKIEINSANTIDVGTKEFTLEADDIINAVTTALTINATATTAIATAAMTVDGSTMAITEGTSVHIQTPDFTLIDDPAIPGFSVKAFNSSPGKTVEVKTGNVVIDTDYTIQAETKDVDIKAETFELVTNDGHTKITMTQDSDIVTPAHDSLIELEADNLTVSGNLGLSGADLTLDYTNRIDVTGTNNINVTTANLNVDATDTTLDGSNLTITETGTTHLVTDALNIDSTSTTIDGTSLTITESSSVGIGTAEVSINAGIQIEVATPVFGLDANAVTVDGDTLIITETETTINSTDKVAVTTAELDLDADVATIDGTSLTITETDTNLVGENLVINQTTGITATTDVYELNAVASLTETTDVYSLSAGTSVQVTTTDETHTVSNKYLLSATNDVEINTTNTKITSSDSVDVTTEDLTVGFTSASLDGEHFRVGATSVAEVVTPDLILADSTSPGTPTFTIHAKAATAAGNDSQVDVRADNIQIIGVTTIDGLTTLNAGAVVPTGQIITIEDQPTQDTDGVNKKYVDDCISDNNDSIGTVVNDSVVAITPYTPTNPNPPIGQSGAAVTGDITITKELMDLNGNAFSVTTEDVKFYGSNGILLKPVTSAAGFEVEISGEDIASGILNPVGMVSESVVITPTANQIEIVETTKDFTLGIPPTINTVTTTIIGSHGTVIVEPTNPGDPIEISTLTHETQISGLNGRLTAQELLTGQHTSQISIMQSDISTAQGNITTLQGQMTAAQAAITQAQTDIIDNKTDADTSIAGLDTRLTQAETDITDNKADADASIASLDTRLTQAETDITDNKADADTAIAGLDTRLAQAETDIADLRTDLTTTQNDLTAVDTRLTTAEGEIVTHTTQIADHEARLVTLSGQAIQNSGNITLLQTRMTSAEGNITTLQGQMTAAQTDIATNKTDADTAIAGLDTRLTQAETDITTLQTDLGTAQGDITALDGRVTQNETDIAALQAAASSSTTDLSALEARVAQNETDISTLQSDITTVQSDLTTVQGDITTVQTDLGTAQADIATHTSEIAQLQTDVGNAASAISGYDSTVATAMGTPGATMSDFIVASVAADATTAANSGLITALTARVAALEALLANITGPLTVGSAGAGNVVAP